MQILCWAVKGGRRLGRGTEDWFEFTATDHSGPLDLDLDLDPDDVILLANQLRGVHEKHNCEDPNVGLLVFIKPWDILDVSVCGWDSRSRPRLLDCQERRSSVERWTPVVELVLGFRLAWGLRSDSTSRREMMTRAEVIMRTGVKTRMHHDIISRLDCWDGCWLVLENAGKRRRNILEAALEDFPKSASERWMGFLVWCRCFLNKTKLIFSFSSGGMRPSAICRSTMSSEIKVGWSICHENCRYPERFKT